MLNYSFNQYHYKYTESRLVYVGGPEVRTQVEAQSKEEVKIKVDIAAEVKMKTEGITAISGKLPVPQTVKDLVAPKVEEVMERVAEMQRSKVEPNAMLLQLAEKMKGCV